MDLQSLWQLLQPYLAGQLRHALGVLAGYLIAKGVIASGDQSAFVSIMSGIVVWGVMALWSIWQKYGVLALKARVAELEALRVQRVQAAMKQYRDIQLQQERNASLPSLTEAHQVMTEANAATEGK